METDHLDVYADWFYLRGQKNDLKDLSLRCAVKCPYRKEACYVHGSMYSLLRQHDHAVVWFKRALAIDPQYTATLILLGNEYLELKKPKEAAASYLTAAGMARL
jgi:tetratricopeptide (TPR) repeat protein